MAFSVIAGPDRQSPFSKRCPSKSGKTAKQVGHDGTHDPFGIAGSAFPVIAGSTGNLVVLAP